jgi:heat shock protein HtpX
MERRVDFRDQIAKNKMKSYFLMIIVFFVILILGYVISMATDPGYFFIIMIFATIFSIFYLLVNFYNSDKIAIAAVGAKEAKQSNYRDFHNLVEGLCIASGMPKPKLYIMDSMEINAFATGRDPEHGVICVTKGAIEKLTRRELEGVLAHELGHIASYDMRYMTMVAVMVGMISIISQLFLRSLWFRRSGGNDSSKTIFMIIGIVLAIVAPIVVYFVQMSISRKREFTADASAVKFTRHPDGLIKALEKIGGEHKSGKVKVNKALAPLFFANPFKNAARTHPPLRDRINVLKRM